MKKKDQEDWNEMAFMFTWAVISWVLLHAVVNYYS